MRRVTVVAVAAGAALLVTACSSAPGQPAPTAPVTSTAPATPVPATSAPPSGSSATPADVRTAAARYLAIARPANRRLDHDFDGLEDASHDDLGSARAFLRDAAATERHFDRQLLRLTLPPDVEAVARLLVAANQSRARLTDAAARSTSLAQVRRYRHRLTAANAPVEDAVRVIRSQLNLPPPSTG
jgi:hypothetical protein